MSFGCRSMHYGLRWQSEAATPPWVARSAGNFFFGESFFPVAQSAVAASLCRRSPKSARSTITILKLPEIFYVIRCANPFNELISQPATP